MIDSNDLLRIKVLLIDTENRKKFNLPLCYGKVTDNAPFEEILSGLTRTNKDWKKEEDFIIIDSL